MDAEARRQIDLAKEAFGRRRSDLAEGFIRNALAREPDYEWAVISLSAALRYQRKYPGALEQARLAIRRFPASGYAHITLATILAVVEENEEALAHGREALRLMPQHPRHYGLLANVLFELGRFDEAIDIAYAGLAIRADHPQLLRVMAIALAGAGRKRAAIAVLADVVRGEPAECYTFVAAAWVALLVSEPVLAIEHARQALILKPTSADAHGVLGLAMLELNDPAQAGVHLNESHRLNPYGKRIRRALDRLSSLKPNEIGS